MFYRTYQEVTNSDKVTYETLSGVPTSRLVEIEIDGVFVLFSLKDIGGVFRIYGCGESSNHIGNMVNRKGDIVLNIFDIITSQTRLLVNPVIRTHDSNERVIAREGHIMVESFDFRQVLSGPITVGDVIADVDGGLYTVVYEETGLKSALVVRSPNGVLYMTSSIGGYSGIHKMTTIENKTLSRKIVPIYGVGLLVEDMFVAES